MEFDTIVAPAHWADYLINGDASELDAWERRAADTWLRREGVRIVGAVEYADPWFSWQARLFVPELDCEACAMLDYVCKPHVRLDNPQTHFASFTEFFKYFNFYNWKIAVNAVHEYNSNRIGIFEFVGNAIEVRYYD